MIEINAERKEENTEPKEASSSINESNLEENVRSSDAGETSAEEGSLGNELPNTKKTQETKATNVYVF